MSLNILFTIGSLEIGGAEGQMSRLACDLSLQGHTVYVFSIEQRGPLAKTLEESGVKVFCGTYNRKKIKWIKFFQLLKSFFSFRKKLQEWNPDIVHSWLPLANFISTFWCSKKKDLCVITSKRALGTHLDRAPYWKPFERYTNRHSDCILANSEAVRRDIHRREGVPLESIKVLYNGLDFKSFQEQQKFAEQNPLQFKGEPPYLLCIGNLIPYKGHHDLIQALASPECQPLAWTLLVVGEDRGIQTELANQVAQNQIGDRVHFLGRRSDIPELLSIADIFILPSHEEGFSNALLEAMAAGKAIVATDVGGNPEALGVTGRLAQVQNPQSLAQHISSLIRDPEDAQQLGELAQKRIREKFSFEVMVQAHLDLYQQLVSPA